MTELDREPPTPSRLVEDRTFRAALEAMFDQVAIGEAIRDATGTIVDFRMLYMNEASLDGAGRGSAELVGRTVIESFPGWGESGLLERYAAVVETGEPYVQDRVAYEDVAPDGTVISGHWSLSVSKFGDGYITASRNVTEIVADEVARREVEREIEGIRTAVQLLRRAALPSSLPELAGLELAARYESAGASQPVGGDWYDAFDLGHGDLGIVVADVAGHGFDAAAFMVQVRNVVRTLAFEHRAPDVVLSKANEVIALFDDHDLFATCCYAIVSPAAGTFSWASAGHLQPVKVGEQPTLLASAVGPPLGVSAAGSYELASVAAAAGDLFVLYTDGLVEERGRPIQESLDALVRDAPRLRGRSAADVADLLVAGAVDRSDDLAVLCVRVTGA